jgi:hypothetical protein
MCNSAAGSLRPRAGGASTGPRPCVSSAFRSSVVCTRGTQSASQKTSNMATFGGACLFCLEAALASMRATCSSIYRLRIFTSRSKRPSVFCAAAESFVWSCPTCMNSHGKQGAEASHVFMRESCLGHTSRVRGIGGLMRAALGNSEHLWMWDEPSLSDALHRHGFIGLRRAQFGDCQDPAFAKVEDPGRFEQACAMQAMRP